MTTRWEVPPTAGQAAAALAASMGISRALAEILIQRGYRDETACRAFLDCPLRDLKDPSLLPGMDAAVERIRRAIATKESVAIYGDYDVDGVASVALLARVFEALGAARPRLFLPDRFDEGYGLTRAGLERCLAKDRPALLIVLDCGTNSTAEVEMLRQRGVDVVILDHHEPSSPARPFALVNYKIKATGDGSQGAKAESVKLEGDQKASCSEGGHASSVEHRASSIPTEYCTAGLAFKFCHALIRAERQAGHASAQKVDLKQYLDLVALATVADLAPLTGENRVLVRRGLRQMEESIHPGLRALMDVAALKGTPTASDCGFKLGPRLNAAGRLESAMAALHLLLSDSEEAALPLARDLDATNRERQNEERRVLKEAQADAETLASDPENRVLVVSRRGWHEGVVGIVASRLMREFHMPAFVIALGPDGEGKGSGRSVEGFNLAHAVQSTSSLLLRGGGHAMAAGVSIREENVEAWRGALQKHAREEQGQEAGSRFSGTVLRADAQVDLGEIREELVADLARLEPCGMGNPRPVLMARGVEVAGEPKRVGKEGAHLKLWLRQNGAAVDAIAFGKGSLPVAKGDRLDVLFEAGINEYQGARRPQMNLREIAKEAA